MTTQQVTLSSAALPGHTGLQRHVYAGATSKMPSLDILAHEIG
jgi:hypothetical protein